MAVRIQFRRGTKTQWETANPTLSAGELGYQSTDKILKFGDGSTPWNSLPVAAAGDVYAVLAGNGLKYGALSEPAQGSSVGQSGVVELEIDESKVITTNAMNAKGDILVGTADNSYSVLGVGTNGQALIVNSSAPTGLNWGTISDPVISNGYISNAMLASNAVTDVKITNGSVTEAKLASGSVTATKLAANSVSTSNIVDANVTDVKLASNSVTTAKINNLAVTTDKLAANAVTAAKVGSDVYQRSTTGFTASSARIFISNSSTPPSGAAGDIWFKY